MVFDYRREYQRYKYYYLKLKDFSSQPITKASLSLVASLLTVSILAIFAIKPTLTTIAKLINQINNDKKIENQLALKIISLKEIQKRLEEIKPFLPVIEKALPSNHSFSRIEREIEYLAFKDQILLESVNVGQFWIVDKVNSDPETDSENQDNNLVYLENQTEPVFKLDLNLSVSGTYKNLKQFLFDLENIDRIIKIDNLNFSKNINQTDKNIKLSIVAQAYYLKTKSL